MTATVKTTEKKVMSTAIDAEEVKFIITLSAYFTLIRDMKMKTIYQHVICPPSSHCNAKNELRNHQLLGAKEQKSISLTSETLVQSAFLELIYPNRQQHGCEILISRHRNVYFAT